MSCGSGVGATALAGFQKNTNGWDDGTAEQVDAGFGFEYLSESISYDVPHIRDESNAGSVQQGRGERGNERHDGGITAYAKYEGLDEIIAQAFGSVESGPAQQASSAAYQTVYRINDCPDGIFGTLVFEKRKDNRVWEYDCVKVVGLRISGEAGQPVQVEFTVAGRRLKRNAGTGVNTTTTIDSVTIPANRKKVHFNHLQLLIAAQSDSTALDAEDESYPSRFELTMEGQFDTDIFTTKNKPYRDEPKRNGHVLTTLTLEYPEYDGEDWLDRHSADPKTLLMAQMTFDSALDAGGGNNFSWVFDMAQLEVSEAAANIAGAGLIRHPITLIATKADSAPQGFSFADQLVMTVVNQMSTDPLA